MQRGDYLNFRRKFEPENVKLVIVAESPPASGKYFYNPVGMATTTAKICRAMRIDLPLR
jgi:hypothetical protein